MDLLRVELLDFRSHENTKGTLSRMYQLNIFQMCTSNYCQNEDLPNLVHILFLSKDKKSRRSSVMTRSKNTSFPHHSVLDNQVYTKDNESTFWQFKRSNQQFQQQKFPSIFWCSCKLLHLKKESNLNGGIFLL